MEWFVTSTSHVNPMAIMELSPFVEDVVFFPVGIIPYGCLVLQYNLHCHHGSLYGHFIWLKQWSLLISSGFPTTKSIRLSLCFFHDRDLAWISTYSVQNSSKDLFPPPRLWSFSTSMIVIFFHLYDCDIFPPPRLGYFSTSTIVLVTNHWSVEHSDKITSTPVNPPVHAGTATR